MPLYPLNRLPLAAFAVLWAVLPRSGVADDLAARGLVPRFRMPGTSHRGPLPELTERQRQLRSELQADLQALVVEIGQRNTRRYRGLRKAARFVEQSLRAAGYKNVEEQSYDVRGRQCSNWIVELPGATKPHEVLVVGAHYDSAVGTPGANDNGTGAVGVLALARRFAHKRLDRTLRFALFVNEEPPWFQTADMGSLVYARRCKSRQEQIVGMLSLETIGYYSDAADSQKYPPPFSLYYPSVGNFVAFVGDVRSGPLVARTVEQFRRDGSLPSEGCAIPGRIQGAGWSDHWSFWQQGYPALMVTDTALFRYPHYHKKSDTLDKLDLDRMTLLIDGLERVLQELGTVNARP